MWRCSSMRWSTEGPTSQARSDTRHSAGGTRRAGTGTHARSVLPSAARDTYTGRSRPRTAHAGGRYTAPCSRVPRTGAGTLQGRAETVGGPGTREGARTHPEPVRVAPDPLPPHPIPIPISSWSGFLDQTPPHSRVPPISLVSNPTAQRPHRSALTGVAVGTEVAMAAAALARPHAHLILRARGVAFAHRCGREGP